MPSCPTGSPVTTPIFSTSHHDGRGTRPRSRPCRFGRRDTGRRQRGRSARLGRGDDARRADQRGLAAPRDAVAAQRVARGVRHVVVAASADDPAQRHLVVAQRLWVGERAVSVDRVRGHEALHRLARHEPPGRVEGECERNGCRRRVDDRGGEPAVALDAVDDDAAAAGLRRDDELPATGGEPDLTGRRQEVRRIGVRKPERSRRAAQRPKPVAADDEPLESPRAARVQDVDEIARDGNARREPAP